MRDVLAWCQLDSETGAWHATLPRDQERSDNQEDLRHQPLNLDKSEFVLGSRAPPLLFLQTPSCVSNYFLGFKASLSIWNFRTI